MKEYLSIILILLTFLQSTAQQKEPGTTFRGGMMLHTGYLWNTRSTETINGICSGIGGQLSYTMKNNLRFGTEGYASSIPYREQDGYYKLGWGGLLAGYQVSNKKIHPVLGITVGGGVIKDLYFVEHTTTDRETDRVVYRHYGVMLGAPSLSIEYSAKQKLTFILKLDYLFPIYSSHNEDFAFGPRVYLGILFNRK